MRRINKRLSNRGDKGKMILALLLFFVFFPYLVSIFQDKPKMVLQEMETNGSVWVVQEQYWGETKVLLEEYLVGMLAATIPPDFGEEVLKAQAILLRSFCISQAELQDGMKIIRDAGIRDFFFTKEQYETAWGADAEVYETKLSKAVKDTGGLILVWQEDVISPPFFYISSGQTRNPEEYLVSSKNYGYLKSAECKTDIFAPDYIDYVEIPQKKFWNTLQSLLGEQPINSDTLVLYRDSSDYVRTLKLGEQEVDGEKFRYALGLSSSCFYIESMGEQVCLTVKGKGHGFGFSQYAANELAKQGQSYQQLLDYFFTELEIKRI